MGGNMNFCLKCIVKTQYGLVVHFNPLKKKYILRALKLLSMICDFCQPCSSCPEHLYPRLSGNLQLAEL